MSNVFCIQQYVSAAGGHLRIITAAAHVPENVSSGLRTNSLVRSGILDMKSPSAGGPALGRDKQQGTLIFVKCLAAYELELQQIASRSESAMLQPIVYWYGLSISLTCNSILLP